MFLSNCYETAAVKVNYQKKNKIIFNSTISKGDILRPGVRVGILLLLFDRINSNNDTNANTKSKESFIELFSSELKLEEEEDNNNKISVIWIGKQPNSSSSNSFGKQKFSMAYAESHPVSSANDNIRCENIECIDVEHMNHLKIYLTYSSQFTPTVGDKLQTPTSQKGVITELVNDENMPYVVLNNGDCFIPDMLINPHFLKRQTFDNLYLTGLTLNMNFLPSSSLYMNNCFSYSLNDTVYYIRLGELLSTGKVMNPNTGLPYLRPVHKREPGKHYYYHHHPSEYVDEDGFTCIDKRVNNNINNNNDSPHEIVKGSIFFANYYNVNNHKANAMMHSSKCDEIVRTDFSGAPVRGKRGGFSTGPQEHLAMAGMGMERFNTEISHIRSDFCGVEVHPSSSSTNTSEILGASSTFMRINDDINLRSKRVAYEITRHNTVKKKKDL